MSQAEHFTTFGTVIVGEWLRASAADREALRMVWPALADALDGLTWHPGPAPLGTGTPEAPASAQNRSEGAACALCQRPTTDGHVHGRDEWYQWQQEQRRRRRQAGDMHEPPGYPAHRLHFE